MEVQAAVLVDDDEWTVHGCVTGNAVDIYEAHGPKGKVLFPVGMQREWTYAIRDRAQQALIDAATKREVG